MVTSFFRSKSPDYIYCGKCHQLVGQSSTVAPHQVGYHGGPYNQGNHPGGQLLPPPGNNSQPIVPGSHNGLNQGYFFLSGLRKLNLIISMRNWFIHYCQFSS